MFCYNSFVVIVIYIVFFVTPIDEVEVHKTIISLNNSKAYDYYEISNGIIKTLANHVKYSIENLFNESVNEGIFPFLLKFSKVIPVYINNDSTDPNNYRPISLLPIISKVFESLMLRRLNDFLLKFNIIDKSQHGFRKGLSTSTAAFQYIEKYASHLTI
jgi:hypothetical protein